MYATVTPWSVVVCAISAAAGMIGDRQMDGGTFAHRRHQVVDAVREAGDDALVRVARSDGEGRSHSGAVEADVNARRVDTCRQNDLYECVAARDEIGRASC